MSSQVSILKNFERFILFGLPQPVYMVLLLGMLTTMVSVSMDYSGETGQLDGNIFLLIWISYTNMNVRLSSNETLVMRITFIQRGWHHDVRYRVAVRRCAFTYMPDNLMLPSGVSPLLHYKFTEEQWNSSYCLLQDLVQCLHIGDT